MNPTTPKRLIMNSGCVTLHLPSEFGFIVNILYYSFLWVKKKKSEKKQHFGIRNAISLPGLPFLLDP